VRNSPVVCDRRYGDPAALIESSSRVCMATKKRAQLVPGLLEGRRAAPSATLHVLPAERRERLAEVVPVEALQCEPPPQHAARKGAKRRGDLSAVPIAARQAIPIAAETVFHQKGSATAASFRPWYWQY
jgi:hypothetical protein